MRVKNLFVWISAVGVATLCCRARADYAITVENTPGLLGYFPLNSASGGTTLSSNGTYTGTLVGSAAVTAAASAPIANDPAGLALPNNPDSGSYVTTSLSGGVTAAGTVMAWVKLNSEPSSTGRIYYIDGESQVGDDFDFQITNDNVLRFYTAAGSNLAYGSTASPALAVGAYSFVAATFDASAFTRDIYLNGQLVASDTGGSSTSPRGAFQIGNTTTFGGRDLDGDIDEAAVFSTALTSSQISAIYSSAVPEPTSVAILAAGVIPLLGRRKAR